MATMSELVAQGITKMRLPTWNAHAYAVPRPEGPWADVYHGLPFGEPSTPALIGECDEHTDWEPC